MSGRASPRPKARATRRTAEEACSGGGKAPTGPGRRRGAARSAERGLVPEGPVGHPQDLGSSLSLEGSQDDVQSHLSGALSVASVSVPVALAERVEQQVRAGPLTGAVRAVDPPRAGQAPATPSQLRVQNAPGPGEGAAFFPRGGRQGPEPVAVGGDPLRGTPPLEGTKPTAGETPRSR